MAGQTNIPLLTEFERDPFLTKKEIFDDRNI
jgi:hypothetical protein